VTQPKKPRSGDGAASVPSPLDSELCCKVADSVYSWEYWLDPKGNYVFVSPSCERFTGYTRDEFFADPELVQRLVHPDDKVRFEQHIEQAHGSSQAGTTIEIELRIVARDGTERWIAHRCAAMVEPDGRDLGRWISNTDVSRYKLAEERLLRLNRELLAIRDCARAALRADNEQRLLTDACRIMCNVAGYRMAWIGTVEHDEAKTIRPVAWSGVEDGYLGSANITWADSERGRGPTGTAARTGRSQVIDDYASDPTGLPWRARAYQRGYRSSAAVPLFGTEHEVWAVLTVYAAEAHAFPSGTISLLEQMAEDLALGMRSLRDALG
jgi:PAS domain S-box-containing protein